MVDPQTISFADPLTGIEFSHENYGGWTGKFTDPNGEEISVYLPGTLQDTTPDQAHLNLIRSVMVQLPSLRAHAIPFARMDVINDLDKWGLLDDNNMPFWETCDDMSPWGTMTEADYDAEFQLMGLIIPETPTTPDEFALGFWSEVDGEHGVGVRFQNNQPTEMLSWCDFF